jgi:hypothetical protein
MKTANDRAFKEWAVSCEALRTGRQILLVRKGGIREEGGRFTINDPEFFLMPTYEHQNANLLQPEFLPHLQKMQAEILNYDTVTLSAYAIVDTILEARDETQVNDVARDHIWNAEYVRQRFDFNAYDPLYLVVLRVYSLPTPQTVPMRPAYIGCKSWVTLDAPISTAGALPALSDHEFADRRTALLQALK